MEHEEGVWQEIVKKKYLKNNWISHITQKPSNSPVRNDLVKIKHIYVKGRVTWLGNGKSIDFWHDTWCGSLPLKDRFPNLYDICFDQKCFVHTICCCN